ncbi:MAG: hypothetical protein IT181_02470 [Acidobacteria bacterium]|nr:hypothetical protein [Acidobacteriota bacterium]
MDSQWPDGAPPQTPPAAPAVELSAAHEKFNSCRWQRAAEGDMPACCGHRDVLPMAGATNFNPDAWCSDCAYYKAKRAPKARPAPNADAPYRWNS